jgi:hypothetical protein
VNRKLRGCTHGGIVNLKDQSDRSKIPLTVKKMAHLSEAVTMEMRLKKDPNTNLAFTNDKSHGKPGSLLHRLHVKRLIVVLGTWNIFNLIFLLSELKLCFFIIIRWTKSRTPFRKYRLSCNGYSRTDSPTASQNEETSMCWAVSER